MYMYVVSPASPYETAEGMKTIQDLKSVKKRARMCHNESVRACLVIGNIANFRSQYRHSLLFSDFFVIDLFVFAA